MLGCSNFYEKVSLSALQVAEAKPVFSFVHKAPKRVSICSPFYFLFTQEKLGVFLLVQLKTLSDYLFHCFDHVCPNSFPSPVISFVELTFPIPIEIFVDLSSSKCELPYFLLKRCLEIFPPVFNRRPGPFLSG